MMRIRTIWIAALSLLLLFLQLSPVFAEDGLTASQRQYQTNFSDTSLSGGMTYTQQYFQVESYWDVASVDVHLDYTISQLTQNDRSSITLQMNGTPFYSFRPTSEAAGQQQITVNVPVELLIQGVNTLTIQGHLETTSPAAIMACVPIDTRDNWLQIAKSSRVNVNYTQHPIQLRIRDFNTRFIGLDTVKEGLSVIAVPEGSSPEELEAATYVLAGFARANPVSDKPIPLIAYDTGKLQGKQAVVMVSLYENLPAELKSQVASADVNNQAIIQLVTESDQPILLITSVDPGMLIKAARLAANQSLLSQIDSASKQVDSSTEVDTPPAEVSRNVSLTETGDKLVGDRHREKSYFIALPGNRSIADATKLSVKFRYARNLDFDRSLVTVLVNDTPIGSKKLSTELADGDHMDLIIPKTLNISGNFTVKLAFDLELKNGGCIENQEQMPWAFVEKDSMLQLNTKDRADLLFNNYPYPFLRDGSFNQVAVILPKEHDAYLFQTLTNVFNLLGRYAQTNTGEVLYYTDSVDAKLLKGRQIIAIGSYQSNQAIRDNNDKLYFQYDENGRGFVSNEKMSIESGYGTRIGTLQLINSPYENGYGMLAVTGSASEYTYLASKLIGSEGTLWQVFGDGAVTDKDGHVQAFRFKQIATAEPSTVLSDIVQRVDVLGFMAAAVLVAVLILFSLLLMVRKYRRMRGNRR
ncbi:cellulose biosynthesis cyclic di-GMP-binding regulatory protein BcsB [Paenibacillus hexagrammi]|uniref:Cellulose biosynthesis cyclic di-GMP-binding regulatory protein BcsB n=1 Tax=Paenibacillus hexagrammi TaxID=2908839 RepID=A0ABY3SSI9_9BACL|nr:cellulose biosynthesis cyclic di-GMP-binding regulatory protein BcsB [Paenibacillus sp. YPD9-1]UJF36085.1 cellulose biosynthesis cyclic di-GMP-binding regulatory protein BcsB [Paenibacillus sp. YPD9-1]